MGIGYLWCDRAESVRSRKISFFLLTVCTIFTATFAENSIHIGQLFPEIQRVEGCRKQEETKDIFCFVWLYLKINIPDFRLILLGHITFLFLGSGRLQGQLGVAWTIYDFKNVSDPGSSSLRTFWSLVFVCLFCSR